MRSQFYLTGIPVVLRDALETRARTMGTSVANIVGEILAARYGIEFTPSARKIHPRFAERDEYVRPDGQDIGRVMNMYLPSAIVEALRNEARDTGVRQRGIVLSSLATSLGVTLPTTKPRNRGHGRPRGRMVKT